MNKKRVPKERLNLRMPKHLANWLKKYAQENNSTATQVIVDMLSKSYKKDQSK